MRTGLLACGVWMAALALAQRPAELGKRCQSCHQEHVEDVKGHPHGDKGIGCETCHGESQQHRNAAGATSPDRVAAPEEAPALCGGCHPAQRKPYAESAHGKLVLSASRTRAANCGTCHGVHAVRNVAAMRRQCDRCHPTLPAACLGKPAVMVVAGKLACMGCHDPHSLSR